MSHPSEIHKRQRQCYCYSWLLLLGSAWVNGAYLFASGRDGRATFSIIGNDAGVRNCWSRCCLGPTYVGHKEHNEEKHMTSGVNSTWPWLKP
jgi:hypothetical protein